MLNLQLARKYAMAIFEIAQDEDKLIPYGEELQLVSQVTFSHAELRGFLTNPQIQPKAKKELLTKLFQDELSKTVFNFLMLLVDKRRAALIEAIDIISNGLKASLDEEKGGDLAGRLGSLYDYMVLRLLQANLKNDDKALEEVAGLISELHSAWREISPAKQAAA